MSDWFLVQPSRDTSRFQLICFPYAGAGPTVFHGWGAALPASIELRAVRLPGRATRHREPPITNMTELVTTLLDVLEPELARAPYGFFGHSLGARIAFELTRAIERRGLPPPARVWISASRAPHLPPRRAPIHELPDAELIAELRRYDGAPAEVFENQDLMQLSLPVLRADFALHDTYKCESGPALAVPLSAFGGVDDPYVLAADLEAWSAHTNAGFDVQMFSGGHFYLNGSRAQLLARLSRDLSALAA